MSDAIVAAPASARSILTQHALKEEGEQRKLLAQYIHGQMVEGTDFGKIPGTDKPTLLKPGAEKLVDLFRCTPKFHLVKIEEDFDKGFFNYVFRVRLYQRDADAVLAEGFGSANSREGRYRWRDSQRLCPTCQKAAIIKGKAEYGGGWLCFAKKGGCGAKFKDGDASVEKQTVGRVENDDVATLANTILKMAKKRALVDGAIALARCSDMFTQDVEDIAELQPDPPPPPPARAQPPAPTSRPATAPAPVQARTEAAKEKLKARFHVVDVAPGETEAQAKAREVGRVVEAIRNGHSVATPTATFAEAAAKVEAERATPPDESIEAMLQLSLLQKELGWTGEKMGSFIRGATGKPNRKTLNLGDVDKVREAIAAVSPPAHSDRDAPPPEAEAPF